MRTDSREVIISRIWDNNGKEIGYEQKGELVRCKDCKWYDKLPTGTACMRWTGDPYAQASVEDNDYCSYGERK